jgi:hypothetical protein
LRMNKAQTDSPKKQRQLAESPSQSGVGTRMREASRAGRPRLPEGQRTPPKSDCPPLRQVSAHESRRRGRSGRSTQSARHGSAHACVGCHPLPDSGPLSGGAQAKRSPGHADEIGRIEVCNGSSRLGWRHLRPADETADSVSTGSSGDRA